MRLGVLDVGSNTVHLLVVDAHPGARPLPAHSHKAELRLAQLLDDSGAIGEEGVAQLVGTVRDALRAAEDKGVEELLTFATSAVRDARNVDEVLDRVEQDTGVRLTVLSGEEEARLTFLAARRWLGWSAGRLLLLDIGGGSLEIAYGMDEAPDAAVSLPLGAGRLTAGWLPGDPPDAEAVRALRRHARAEIARVVHEFTRLGRPDHVVATSKTFKQLARIAGSARSGEGVYVQRELYRSALEEWVPRLTGMTREERTRLPGVSEGRSGQLLAGALVAEGAMDLFGIDTLEICPWALREGVILRHLDQLRAAEPAPGTATPGVPLPEVRDAEEVVRPDGTGEPADVADGAGPAEDEAAPAADAAAPARPRSAPEEPPAGTGTAAGPGSTRARRAPEAPAAPHGAPAERAAHPYSSGPTGPLDILPATAAPAPATAAPAPASVGHVAPDTRSAGTAPAGRYGERHR